MATARQVIKQWFSNFKKPTQEHFWAWLDSFWHKEDKIPMQSVEGLETALQSVPTSDQFDNHINDGNAHQALFDGKVDKEDGKGLISDAERNQIQINKNKQVVGQTITGDVNKVSTLILEDGSVIQAQFTDVAPAGPDVMLNSQNFDKDTGVLTGVRSDEQQITADLNGRWALLGHTHQIADVADLEDALNGKAEAGHTHAFSDLSGTENIATKQEITDAVGGIKIGGRNLLRNSNKSISNSDYLIATYDITQSLKEGEQVTVTLKGELGAGKVAFAIYNSGDSVDLATLINKGNGIHQATFDWKIGLAKDNNRLNVYTYYSSVIAESSIEWINLERGNKSTDITPAPEDFPLKSELENVIDVTTIDEIGDFKSKSGNVRPHISPTGNFSVFAGEIGSGELLMQVDRYTGIKSPKHIDGKVVSGRKLRASVIDSSWVDLDSRNGELNVTNPADENDYKPIKAKGFKTPNGSVNEVLRADGSTALFMKGEEISGSVSWTANNRVRGNTIFLTGNGDKTIHLHQLENHSIMSFKKCYDGGVVTFQCSGKTIVMRGADAFNGKDGSNAVISIVGNKCYIDINNYE
ncbi:hypothetical protein ACILE2_01560 [Capnocytophaga canimorsus]|uniref:hypothetical protein n=1 Tax=Capnocytophaga canimorsus TaxID=28188 RepID=UPI0037D8FE11